MDDDAIRALVVRLSRRHPSGGKVIERDEIYARVWGYSMARGDRSVDVFVRKLRQKLERASPSWRYIHTHFGIGYRFAAEAEEAVAGVAPPAPAAHAEALPELELDAQEFTAAATD